MAPGLPVLPAAKHTVAAGQDIDVSCPGPGLRAGGERCITHVVLFHRSITGGAESEAAWPTAVQAAAAEQAIPSSWSSSPRIFRSAPRQRGSIAGWPGSLGI